MKYNEAPELAILTQGPFACPDSAPQDAPDNINIFPGGLRDKPCQSHQSLPELTANSGISVPKIMAGTTDPFEEIKPNQSFSNATSRRVAGTVAISILAVGLAACGPDKSDTISFTNGSHSATAAPNKLGQAKVPQAPKTKTPAPKPYTIPATPNVPSDTDPVTTSEKTDGYCKSLFGSNKGPDPIRGYIIRSGADVGQPLSSFLSKLNKNDVNKRANQLAAVVRVDWKQLQSDEDGQVKAYRIVRKLQQLNAVGIDQVRVRIDVGGAGAPQFAIRDSGGGIPVKDAGAGHSTGVAPHFWTKAYGDDLSQLVNRLGRTLDGCKPIKDISFTRNQVYTDAESDVLGVDAESKKHLEAAGLTQAKYQQDNYDDIDLARRAFPNTGFYIAIDTPAQIGETNASKSLELGKRQIDYAIKILGKRAVLGNNSYGKNRKGVLKILEEYRMKMASVNDIPLSSQTATMEKFGRGYMQVFHDAAAQHFYSLELPTELYDKAANHLPPLYQGR